MKALLADGFKTGLSKETDIKPKPMVENIAKAFELNMKDY